MSEDFVKRERVLETFTRAAREMGLPGKRAAVDALARSRDGLPRFVDTAIDRRLASLS